MTRPASLALTLLTVAMALLAACGGGGGGSGPAPVPLAYTVSVASLTATANTDATQSPQASLSFTITGWSSRPSGSSVTPTVTVSGLAASSATASVAAASGDTVTGTVMLNFWPAGSLGAGTYTGSLVLSLCFDATPATCAQMPAGMPTTVPYTLTVTGSATPTTTATLAPAALTVIAGQDAPSAPTSGPLALSLSAASPPVHVQAASPASALVSALGYQAIGASGGAVSLTLVPPGTLAVGAHVDRVTIEVCLDAACQRPLKNSPIDVPISYTVIPLEALAGWYQGGFSGKKVVVWGNSTVSNAVSFFQRLDTYAAPGSALPGLDPASILNYGNNGASLAALLAGQGPFPIAAVIAAKPDLLIMRGPLINDVRLGATDLAQAEQLLTEALTQITQGTPNTSVLLTTENSLLTTDVGGTGLVQPNSAAQQYTDILHAAPLAMKGRFPRVAVYDVMAVEYGTIAQASSPLMLDQLHPNQAGQQAEADLIATLIGVPH